ncbi:MAG: hypothetical protein GF344_10215, partial [Chitinivibrionales bacterium]|nr:hypothetical protein [Chitinivibrionales bacterium]
ATIKMISKSRGLVPIETAAGIKAFYDCMSLSCEQIVVAAGNKQLIRSKVLSRNNIRPTAHGASQNAIPQSNNFVEDAVADDLLKKTLHLLKEEFAQLLKIKPEKIDVKAALEKYGIDSILAMNATNHLEKTFGALPRTLFFEYQTIAEIAEYFVRSHGKAVRSLPSPASSEPIRVGTAKNKMDSKSAVFAGAGNKKFIRRIRGTTHNARENSPLGYAEPIAVVGISGRYPKSFTINEYWKNLRNGKDCVIEVPPERWDWREYYNEDRNAMGYHNSKWGGFIDGVDEFDPRFFNISPREARTMDPQERLFLQHAWMALEDAGYNRAGIQIKDNNYLPGQVGVYVGVMYGEYQLFGVNATLQGRRTAIPGSYASIANRVSYVLNLHGPSMTLDTMCSSSFTAIHLACMDLKLRRTQCAVAGGVNVSIHPNKYLMLSNGQFLSSEGRCQSFGEGGEGYIPGEGVGAVILKRLSEAVIDGDNIYGVILGSALNHGGKTNGYSVPNPHAQASVISRALSEANTEPRHISYIEAHGTGTVLGDPIEIAALTKAFRKRTEDNGFCMIGSAKSNIGHCESAAAIAGLTKVLLQIKHRRIVPSLHSERLNPHIDFDSTPFIVNQKLFPWEQPVINGCRIPRIAGISSFGAGGSNAHLIVREYVPSIDGQRPAVIINKKCPIIIPLSARTEEQLYQKAMEMLAFICNETEDGVLHNVTQEDKPAYLASIAYTLQVGREPLDERLAFIVDNIDQLIEKIRNFCSYMPIDDNT